MVRSGWKHHTLAQGNDSVWKRCDDRSVIPTAAELLDSAFGTVDRRIFWDQAIYERELERIFARSWLFVAHESQVQTPGSFVTAYMGEDSVMVARDNDRINVFLTSCPHRGNRVCFADSGQGCQFTCNLSRLGVPAGRVP